MGRSLRARHAAGAALLALATLAGTSIAQAQSGPPQVTVARPVIKELAEWMEFTGQFVPVERVEMRARVTGYLTEVHFDDGQLVEREDLLYTIDPRPFRNALDDAVARADEAQATVDLAEVQLTRTQRLTSDDFASRATLEERTAELGRARAVLAAAKAAVADAELNLSFAEVRAPIAGRASYSQVTEGNLVVGGGQGATLLTTIVSADPIWFEFDMSEADFLDFSRENRAGRLPTIRDSVEVQVRLIDEDAFDRTGRLGFVDNAVERGTGTIRARALFANPDRFLTAGQFGILRIPATEVYPAVLIPDGALVSDQSNKLVMTVDANNVVVPKVVRPGPGEFGLRIIREGLDGSERIIINGLARARPGQPVDPVEGEVVLGDGRL
jgi:RND family efflux transporter MFP subunit